MAKTTSTPHWWARGLLFENCSCQVVCPGHLHFEQNCTHDRCLGYWAVAVADGAFDGVSLAGVRALVTFDSPKRMLDGGWTQRIIIDEAADPDQRTSLETILLGKAGGPWEILAQFVGEHAETQYLPIRMETDTPIKRVSIDGIIDASVEPIRGRDKSKPVRFENIFNQIHAPSQVIARGSTQYDDGVIAIHNEGTHGLYSEFSWSP